MKQTQARKRRKKNAKKPRNINELESEESDNYFSISEDEINDIETTREGNYGENCEENLEENFEDNFEGNVENYLEEIFEEKFEENHKEKLEVNFEEPYFKENLK